jgi:hypothetical protein
METKPKRAYNKKVKVKDIPKEVIPPETPDAAYFEALAEEYRKNAEAAYERVRMVEAEMARMRTFYTNTMAFVEEQTVAYAKTVKLATKGEF